MRGRPKHPNKDIESAVQYARACGWRYKKPGKSAHTSGKLLCALKTQDGCRFSI
jgi:hypothetical protein